MACHMCQQRGKDWNGDNPNCPFDCDGNLLGDNWNCATINAIRDICYEGQEHMPDGVDYQYCGDQKYATIKVDEIEDLDADALWVSWYKNRGGTDQLWLLSSNYYPRQPMEQELLDIISYYRVKERTTPDER